MYNNCIIIINMCQQNIYIFYIASANKALILQKRLILLQNIIVLSSKCLYSGKILILTKTVQVNERDSKGTVFLWQNPEAAPLAGFGAEPRFRQALRKASP